MKWWIEWGSNVEGMRAAQAAGVEVPALANEPKDRPDLELYLHCYLDVSAERSFNGNITFGAVAIWCAAYEIEVGQVWSVLRVADIEIHKWQATRSKP